MPKELDRAQLFKFAETHRREYEDLLQQFVETRPSPAIRRTRKISVRVSR